MILRNTTVVFVLETEPLILLHAAGEQEDFRPLFLPGPPALVLWSGAVPRGLSQSNVRQNATVCIRGEPLSAGSPAGRGFQRRGPKFQPRPGAQPGHPTVLPPPAGGNAPGRRPAATRGGAPGGFYDQARAWRLERRDFAQRSTYFEVKAGRGGKRARRRVDRELRQLQI